MDIPALDNYTNGVEGYLSPKEGRMLYALALEAPRADIVEIGSWKGKSTVWLASGIEKAGGNRKVYAIDHHVGSSEHIKQFGKINTFQEFENNIKGAHVDPFVVPLVKTSVMAAKEWDGRKVGMLWIDGEHSYPAVKEDYMAWEPFLMEGGIIAFHDTDNNGPRKFAEKYIYRGKKFKNIGFAHGITYARKVTPASFADQVKNRWTLLVRTLYLFAASLRPPGFVKKAGTAALRAFGMKGV